MWHKWKHLGTIRNYGTFGNCTFMESFGLQLASFAFNEDSSVDRIYDCCNIYPKINFYAVEIRLCQIFWNLKRSGCRRN